MKPSSRRSDHERSRHSSQHYGHSPAHSTGRSPDAKLDMVHRESPATSPRTRHVMSPGISSRTRHGTAYRSRSPDDYIRSRDDLVRWTVGSDYETSQQQHSGMVLLLLLLLLFVCLSRITPDRRDAPLSPEREPRESVDMVLHTFTTVISGGSVGLS